MTCSNPSGDFEDVKREPKSESADVSGRLHSAPGQFLHQALAVAREPYTQRMIGVLLAIGKEQRQVIGNGFVDPLIAIRAPTDHVAPPLVSDFVKRNKLGEMFLPAFCEAGALLRRGRQKRKRGEV